MKKIISTLLVVTMLLSLMGTTLVSAAWTDSGSRNFKIESAFASYTYITSQGTYTVDGYDSPFGSITEEDVLGMDFRHWDFERISSNTTASKLRYVITSKDLTDDDLASADFDGFVTNPTDKTLVLEAPKTTLGVDKKVYQYSFYAYMDKKTSDELIFRFTNNGTVTAGVTVKTTGDELYSANGVPHKVDVVVYATGNTTDKYFHIALFVDGKFVNGGATKISKAANFKTGCDLVIFYNATTEAKTPTTSLHVSYLYDLFTTEASLTKERADVESIMFTTPIWSTTSDVTTASEFADVEIENVSDDIETAINNTLKNDVEKSISVLSLEGLVNGEGTAKLVKKSDGTEVTDVTGLTVDDVLLEVNGVYISLKQKLTCVESESAVFNPAEHNTIYARLRHENYVDNEYTGYPIGGVSSDFYSFTNEPRSGFTFSSGNIKYNERGFNSLLTYAGKSSYNKKALSEYSVDKNMITAEFDLYASEYTITSDDYFRLAWTAKDDDNSTTGTVNVYFTTDGMGNAPTDGIVVDLEPNSWNTISLQYKYDTVGEKVAVALDVYVNGEYKATCNTGSTRDFSNRKTSGEVVPINFMRLYSPTYLTYSVIGGGKWYVGEYTPKATATADGVITESDDNIEIDEANRLIVSDYGSEELISAMSDYTPVYVSSIDVDVVNNAYDEQDGTFPESVNVEGATAAYKGKIIKKWIENSGLFNVPAVEGVYTLKTADSMILSATDNGDGTATLAFNGTYSNADVYDGVATPLPEIVANTEGAKTDVLVGFAVVEEGKLPKVYTLIDKGIELRSLTYNIQNAQAELAYREYGATASDSVTFQFIVAAYNEFNKVITLKASTSTTISGADEDGEHIITFAPDFTEDVVSGTKYYKVFMFESLANSIPVFDSAKVMAVK